MSTFASNAPGLSCLTTAATMSTSDVPVHFYVSPILACRYCGANAINIADTDTIITYKIFILLIKF